MYEQYKRPPNIHLAKQHAIAKRFAAPSPFQDLDKLELCPCCGYPYKNLQLPNCVSISEFSFIGSGLVLYFDLHRYAQILLLIYISIVGVYTIYDNSQGTRCQYEQCSIDIYNVTSRVNVYKPLDVTASYLNFCTLLVLMISTLIYRRHINKICLEIDDAEIEVSDYSIIIYGLPKNCKQHDIEQYFYQEDEIELRKVCMAYEIKHYLKLLNDLEDKNIELSKMLYEKNKIHIINLQSDILEIKKKLQYVQQYKENIFYFTGIAFLSFNREKHADIVCDQYPITRFQLLLYKLNLIKYYGKRFKDSPIVVKKAPLPGDVLWENLGIDLYEHYKRRVITNAITVFLLSIGLALIFGLSYLQEWINAQVNYDPTTTIIIINFLGFVASLIVSFINAILSSNIIKLVNQEQHATKTEYDISIATKIGMAEFINGAILTLLVNLLIKGQNESRIQTIYQSGGLNSDVLWIFVTDSFLPWFMLILDFEHIKKLYFRRKIKQEGSRCTMTQKEANEIFEGPMINLAEKYPSVMKTLLMAMFYSPLLPVCSMFALLSLIGIYWIEKILLLRRDSRPLPTGSEMALEMVEFYVDLVILIYSIGNILWEYIVFQEIHLITLISLILCGTFYFIPKERVFGWIVNINLDNATEESYDEKVSTFLDDYDRRNPITAEEAKQKWLENNQQDLNISYLESQMRQRYKSFSKVHPEFKFTHNYHFVIK